MQSNKCVWPRPAKQAYDANANEIGMIQYVNAGYLSILFGWG